MEKILQLLIMPDFDSARESLGYDENDDFNSDTVLFQQGYDGEMMDVEDDEVFEIPKGFVGTIESDEDHYLLKDKAKLKHKEEFLIDGDLVEGRYKYSAENNIIYYLSKVKRWS